MNPTDFASEIDRCWFKQHPGAKCFLRPAIAGEWGILHHRIRAEGCKHVLVVQFFEGARVRQPMKIYLEHDDLPTELVWVDTGERWRILCSGEVVPKRPTKRQAWEAFLCDDLRRMAEACQEVGR